MGSRTVLILGNMNIQTRLMQQELKKCNISHVQHMALNAIENPTRLNEYSVVLADYTCLEEQSVVDVLHAETLDFDLVLFNTPESLVLEKLIICKQLKGVLMTSSPLEHLERCVRSVLDGDMWLPRNFMTQLICYYRDQVMPDTPVLDDLTKREKQILDRLVCGQSNQEIAEELFVAESTVKTHIYKLYKKMNVHCRREAIRCVRQAQRDANI